MTETTLCSLTIRAEIIAAIYQTKKRKDGRSLRASYKTLLRFYTSQTLILSILGAEKIATVRKISKKKEHKLFRCDFRRAIDVSLDRTSHSPPSYYIKSRKNSDCLKDVCEYQKKEDWWD